MRKTLVRFSAALTASMVVVSALAQDAPRGSAATGVAVPAQPATYGPDEPQRALKDGKVLRAFRLTTPPDLDGRLNDEVWGFAEVSTGYVQRDPDNGTPMTQQTRVQVAYDDRFLYVGVTCLEENRALIAAGLGRRDDPPPTDRFTIGFDPRHDHQTAYAFQTNPSGWQGDYTHFDDDRSDRDYNAVWEVRTQVLEFGWSAEFQIPFSQMRFTASPRPGQVWGLNAERVIRRLSETGTWVPKPRGERGEVSFFGHLVFDSPVSPPRRLELTPSVLARSERKSGLAGAAGIEAGVDLRLGLGTAATLSATLNPDFGQVEQDPAVLNLSVFETFFPEKRPFFLEDSRTFVPPYDQFQLFHSRRIGRAPGRIAVATDDRVVEQPDETTILGAAKLTGKSAGWTYGALTALTGPEHADVETSIFDLDGTAQFFRQQRLIEPTTSYNVVRLQKDVRNGTSNIGGLATGVFREESEDAFTGGIDYNMRWDQNRTRWDGHWVLTHAPGIGGVKTSGGGLTNFNFSRKHLNVSGHFDHFGRDFRVTDIGFFRTRANRNQAQSYIEVGQPDPWKIFRRFWGFGSFQRSWTDERLMFSRTGEGGLSVQFRNFWSVNGGLHGQARALDDLDTRGGPPIVTPSFKAYFFNVDSDSRKSWRFHLNGNWWVTDADTRGAGFYWDFSLQPTTRLQASIGGSYQLGEDIAQWIVNQDTDGDGAIDYVYGTLQRDVLNLTLRSTYSITRDLTLQAYLQPFVAVGDYGNIRRLARPRSFDFEPVTLSFDPDFNNKSLRGNVILRWEYVRGSTLFFVWNLSQQDSDRPGVFRPFKDLGSAFSANANHVFLVKLSYWLNR